MNSKNLDYSLFYRSKFANIEELNNDRSYDLFISAYNDSIRVKNAFEEIVSKEKHWLIFPEYFYQHDQLPITDKENEKIFTFNNALSEGGIVRDYISRSHVDFETAGQVCIDITGFIRPHLVFLVRYLAEKKNIKNVDFIYSDPIKYSKKEETDFSSGYTFVRQIDGCQGNHNPETTNDILIIAAGYDNMRITDVSKSKGNSKKIQLFGFPSLQPDMYQENIVKAYKAEEATSNGRESFIDPNATLFAPANDPFITANVIKDFIVQENNRKPITNLYLSPLSTKAQTLGIALYFVTDCLSSNVSVIFPFCDQYSKETTEGISKIWRYTIEFDKLK